jgi:hypothetical protein
VEGLLGWGGREILTAHSGIRSSTAATETAPKTAARKMAEAFMVAGGVCGGEEEDEELAK